MAGKSSGRVACKTRATSTGMGDCVEGFFGAEHASAKKKSPVAIIQNRFLMRSNNV